MFESIELRKVENGIIIVIRDEENDEKEYVYDTTRKALKFVKDMLEVTVYFHSGVLHIDVAFIVIHTRDKKQ